MTSKITVTAHPGSGVNRLKIDLIHGTEANKFSDQTFLLKADQSLDLYVYDDRKIVVEEVLISE